MLSHYLKIALRNLLKQKMYGLINILGLSIGLASCVLIMLFVLEHLSYDTFHENSDRIYRVNYKAKLTPNEDPFYIGATPPPVARTLMNEFPEIEMATRIYPGGSLIRYQDKAFEETNILAVDSNFFQMFSFALKEGNPDEVFTQPNSVIITEDMAKKYFGDEQAMGKIVSFGAERTPYKVVGVAQNPPKNSHFTFHMLTSISSASQVQQFDWSWVWSALTTYVQLKEGTLAKGLETKFPGMIKRHVGRTIQRIFSTSVEKFEKDGGNIQLILQPLLDIHLHSEGITSGLGTHGNITYLYIFSCVAAFVLLLACINFMNLSTARSAGRSKEVGVRKVLGSQRSQLVSQFLTESILTCLIAMLVAVAFTEIFLLLFRDSLFDGLHSHLLEHSWLWVIMVGLLFLVGIIAGSYPAFYLSSFKPVEVLKGKLRMGMRNNFIRSTLVVFQFTVSVCLIICTMLVYQQVNYLGNKHLGFDKENVIVIMNTDRLGTNTQVFKNKLNSLPKVISSSFSTGLPSTWVAPELFTPVGLGKGDNLLSYIHADYEYLQTLNIKLKEGRNFSRDFTSDEQENARALLINEAAAKVLGWENPVGKYLSSKRGDGTGQEIIGVMKDYNFKSLHHAVEPLIIMLSQEGDYLSVRVKPGETGKILAIIEQQWKSLSPGAPFDYFFLDERMNAQYRAEQQTGKIFTVFTSLAILIACLGLFGLAAFTAEQRTKEIGIRKVLGASTVSVVQLLSRNFLKLVLVANVLAWPLAWYIMHTWLQEFPYRITIGIWAFAGAALLTAVMALLTVVFQAMKAAHANPVKSLRTE